MTAHELFALSPDDISKLSDDEILAIVRPHFPEMQPQQSPTGPQKEMFTPEQILASIKSGKKPKKTTAQLLADNQAMLERIQALKNKGK